MLSDQHTETLVHAVISSRLDYCNSMYFNMSKSNIYKLQKVQNSAARLISRKSRRQSVEHVMNELHWLRVESRILFKILLLVFKTIKYDLPMVFEYKSHNCRPSDFLTLQEKHCNSKYGKRTFDYAGPRLWNALPLHIRTEESIEVFKKQIKTILFTNTPVFMRKSFLYQ